MTTTVAMQFLLVLSHQGKNDAEWCYEEHKWILSLNSIIDLWWLLPVSFTGEPSYWGRWLVGIPETTRVLRLEGLGRDLPGSYGIMFDPLEEEDPEDELGAGSSFGFNFGFSDTMTTRWDKRCSSPSLGKTIASF